MIERERSVWPELLKLHLMGGFRVAIGEHTITAGSFRLAKSRNLVKLLALARGQSRHREQLMELLWPDMNLSQAANSLSQTLFAARRVLAPDGRDPLQFLVYRRDAICLTAAEPAWVDVEAFETAAAQAFLSPSIKWHEVALALYAGELLPEDRYEDWVSSRREALHQDYLRLCLELARLYQANRGFDQSIGILRQALSSDPANEEINVEMMRLYAMTGQRLQALRQYQALQNVLRRELDVEPDPESTRLSTPASTRIPPYSVLRAPWKQVGPSCAQSRQPSLHFWGARQSCLNFNAC